MSYFISGEICEECEKEVPCLTTDNSSDEFYPTTLCLSCIQKLFEELEHPKLSVTVQEGYDE